ncbi:MAG TPA: DciA family protein [Vicinamibacterales bacterium]|nr:DciA family protein [Vicinamibacterales bacterium]
MRPVSTSIPDALATILRKAPLTDEKVSFAWRTAVGPAVDKATAIELRNGILFVRAKDEAWRREVERSAAVVRARLDSLLGKGIVRTIRVEPR